MAARGWFLEKATNVETPIKVIVVFAHEEDVDSTDPEGNPITETRITERVTETWEFFESNYPDTAAILAHAKDRVEDRLSDFAEAEGEGQDVTNSLKPSA